MSSYYPKIPERLQLYRKALNLTQEQMGKRFGVNQSIISWRAGIKSFP